MKLNQNDKINHYFDIELTVSETEIRQLENCFCHIYSLTCNILFICQMTCLISKLNTFAGIHCSILIPSHIICFLYVFQLFSYRLQSNKKRNQKYIYYLLLFIFYAIFFNIALFSFAVNLLRIIRIFVVVVL